MVTLKGCGKECFAPSADTRDDFRWIFVGEIDYNNFRLHEVADTHKGYHGRYAYRSEDCQCTKCGDVYRGINNTGEHLFQMLCADCCRRHGLLW